MVTVLLDFEKRVKEIELYFEYMNLLFDKKAELYFPENQTRKTKKIDPELLKVLKANCFLLLYNLSESSVRQAMTEVYDNVTSKKLPYSDVKNEIKKIWITLNYKNFKDVGIDNIFEALTNIVDDIIDIQFDHANIISGNIDGRKIREFSDKIGFSTKCHYSFQKGEKLHQVKTQRNALAHGNISFAECGRQYTHTELNIIKDQVIKYLKRILLNIDLFLQKEEYKI